MKFPSETSIFVVSRDPGKELGEKRRIPVSIPVAFMYLHWQAHGIDAPQLPKYPVPDGRSKQPQSVIKNRRLCWNKGKRSHQKEVGYRPARRWRRRRRTRYARLPKSHFFPLLAPETDSDWSSETAQSLLLLLLLCRRLSSSSMSSARKTFPAPPLPACWAPELRRRGTLRRVSLGSWTWQRGGVLRFDVLAQAGLEGVDVPGHVA